MRRMTYARKKAATPATAAKLNEAWRPEAAPVKAEPAGLTGEPVAAGLVEFLTGPPGIPALAAGATGTGTEAAALVGATVTVL